MADAPIVVIGAGGHARVVAEAIGGVQGYLAPERVDDPHGLLGAHLGYDDSIPRLAADGCRFALGIGYVDRPGARRRAELLAGLDALDLAIVVHPAAFVSPTARLGAGAYIGPGTIVGTAATIGRAAIVNSAAVVDHDCAVGENVHIGPGVAISGDVTIGADTLIGVGATVRQGLRIGADVVVGAGSVVVSDVPDGATVLGVPARSVAGSP